MLKGIVVADDVVFLVVFDELVQQNEKVGNEVLSLVGLAEHLIQGFVASVFFEGLLVIFVVLEQLDHSTDEVELNGLILL